MFFAALLIPVWSPAQTPVRVVLVGDSTVNDEGGWGTGFRASFSPDVAVINHAMNGRSSKSFRSEGRWEPVLADKPQYVLLQFGHNDVPGKGPDRETAANGSYRDNLARYVDEARAAGATPVIVTSIVRRNFTPDGKIVRDSLVPYVAAARALAAEKRVPLMDMYDLTLRQSEALGPEGCKEIDAVTRDGKPDHTHLGAKGRSVIGAMAAREFVRVVPELGKYVVAP